MARIFRGYTLAIPEQAGTYTLSISDIASDETIAAIEVVCDKYAVGDTYKIKHLDADNQLVRLIANNIYSIPRDVPWNFTFPNALEVGEDEKIKLIYEHVAPLSLNVFVYLTLEIA